MEKETIRQLLNGRNVQVSDEHLVMLEALTGGIDQMRAALDGAPPPDSDIGLIHTLEESNHD